MSRTVSDPKVCVRYQKLYCIVKTHSSVLLDTAIVNTIEMDDSETRLFVASASNSFHCIDAQSGSVLWSSTSSSGVFLTGAKYSSKYNLVYSIEVSGFSIVSYRDRVTSIFLTYEYVAFPIGSTLVEQSLNMMRRRVMYIGSLVVKRLRWIRFVRPVSKLKFRFQTTVLHCFTAIFTDASVRSSFQMDDHQKLHH